MTMLYQWLDSVGDNTGDKNFIGDYSEDIAYAQIAPPPGKYYLITRMIVTVADNGKFKDNGYGAMNQLDRGIAIQIRQNGQDNYDVTDNLPVKQHSDWAGMFFDGRMITPKVFCARCTFEKAGNPLRLEGDKGDYLRLTLHDDFSALEHHRFQIQGSQETS